MNRVAVVSLLLCLLAAPAEADRSVGVAPFEKSGSGTPPEVATLLADRLTTAGVSCVGPDQLGVPAVAEPEPAQVQTWSKGSGVDAIVFGRVTGIGSRVSVDVQLRSSESGEMVSVHVIEIERPGALDAGVQELARKVLEGLAILEGGGATALAAAQPSGGGPVPPVASRPPARKKDKGFFGSGGGPIRITSDDLEARQSGGARHMIFTRNVKATRDDLRLTSDRLDAFYPKGSSRPEKLVATGDVVFKRSGGEARCHKMTYLQADDRIHCEGSAGRIAELVREGDRARGDKIEWDVETDTIYIKGNADVLLTDEDE